MKIKSHIALTVIVFVFLTGMSLPGNQKSVYRIQKFLPGKVIFRRDVSSALTVMEIRFPAGMLYVNSDRRGLAYLTSRLLMEIQNRSTLQFMMEKGTRFLTRVEPEWVTITMISLSDFAQKSMNYLTEMLKKPLFSGLRIHSVKSVMEYRENLFRENSIELANQSLWDNVFSFEFKNQQYGTKETRDRLSKSDIQQFYQKNFLAGNTIISIASDLEFTEIEKAVNGIAALFSKKKQLVPENIRLRENPDLNKKIEKDLKQSVFSSLFLLPERNRFNYLCAKLFVSAVCEGPGSKLWNLRARRHLTYQVHHRLEYCRDPGILWIYFKTPPEKVPEAKREMNLILEEIRKHGVSDRELFAAKQMAKAQYFRRLESKTGLTKYFGFFEAAGLGIEFGLDFPKLLESVALKEFNAFCQTILDPEKRAGLVVGR